MTNRKNFFAGFLTSDSKPANKMRVAAEMLAATYIAEEENCILVVFKIPNNEPKEADKLINDIENFLHSKLDQNA